MKIFSSSAGSAFLLATSALHNPVNSFPTGSTTSMLPSDAYPTSPEDHTLSSKYEGSYLVNNSVETLDNISKKLNNSLTVSRKLYKEDSFSNTLDDDSFEPWDSFSKLTEEYDKKYPHLTTSVETTTPEVSSTAALEVSATAAPEVSSTATSEVSSTAAPEVSATAAPEVSATATSEVSSTTAPEVSATVSSTASSQEQTSNQGLWSYLSYSIGSLGFILGAAATTFIKNKFCSNETQGESNEEMNMFNPLDFLTPVNNATLELDNVVLMAEFTEDTQA